VEAAGSCFLLLASTATSVFYFHFVAAIIICVRCNTEDSYSTVAVHDVICASRPLQLWDTIVSLWVIFFYFSPKKKSVLHFLATCTKVQTCVCRYRLCLCVEIISWCETAQTGPLKRNIKPLNTEINPIHHLLALLEARHIFHVSRIRVKVEYGLWVVVVRTGRTLVLLLSYAIYPLMELERASQIWVFKIS